jgi:anti-anti-sigma factor
VAQGPVEIELDGCTPRMVIERRVDRTIVTIKPVAPARLSHPHTLGLRLVGMMEEEGPKMIFIDLGEIARITSETLNQLIEVNCRARMTGIRLVLSNLNPTLLQVFRVTRLDRLFEIEAAESVV